MTNKISKLHDHLGFWLGRIAHEVHSNFVDKLTKAGITIPEWCVLIALFHDETTTPALIAKQVGIDRAAISRTVEKLVQRKLIERKIGDDRRYTPLLLTPAAKKIVPKLAELADENEAAFFTMLSEKEKETLKNILYTIADHIGIKKD